MTVLLEQSICKDCLGNETCQKFKRLNPGETIRDTMENVYDGVNIGTISGAKLYCRPGRQKEIFEIIVVNCSQKKRYQDNILC